MVAMSAPRRYRLILTVVLAVALLAALYVAYQRLKAERHSRRVEIAMDYQDFSALSQSYGYDQEQFLVALRRAGLTSLAISEELGANINSGSTAFLIPGQQLIAQAKLAPVTDPTLAALVKTGGVDPTRLYLMIFDPAAVSRYQTALIEHLGRHSYQVLHAAHPTILAIRSQIDYFNNLGLGLPEAPLALAHKLDLSLIPRVQNDERYGAPEIDRIFAGFKVHERPTTVIFFGQRNEVLGFPDHLDDTANAFMRTGLNFGSIETYDRTQDQKGNDGLAEKAIERTTRVQAISKTELDKLEYDTVVARYLLGVRERNIRVVYLRPFLHAQNGMSLEKTNVEMVKAIRDGLIARGFKLGRATPVPDFNINPVVIVLASLAVPAIIMLLFEAFGMRRSQVAYAVFGVALLLVVGGYAVHHDLLARKILALIGAIGFATMGVVAIPRSFTLQAPDTYGGSLLAGLRTLGIATAFALAGALVVVGLVSVPLLMEEIDRFAGVKAVIILPPLLAFALYIYTRRFGNDPPSVEGSALAPVRIYQLAILCLAAGAAFVYISRSGNTSDVSPSAFELALRSNLTALLGVRPRFKEFAIGFPLMMLLPALRLEHKRLVGWLFAAGIAIGTSDVVDTFSHLHTPLVASILRIVNGAVLGIIVGAIAIAVYRLVDRRAQLALDRRRARAA
jgi:hypothetical protein